MSERRCHRCGSTLHTETEGALVFCWHCGAPQVTLSEELLEQAEQLRQTQEARETGADTQARALAHAPGGVVWKNAIQISAMVAAALAASIILFSPLVVVAWSPLAPGIVLALYASRHRETIFSARMGARVGITCGTLIIVGAAIAGSLKLVILRFVLHTMGGFDADLAASMQQMKLQMATQPDPNMVAMFTRWISIPEFRVGSSLITSAFGAVILLVLTAAGGAFAGVMRGRVRAKQSS